MAQQPPNMVVRPLSQEFIEKVLVNLPTPPGPNDPLSPERMKLRMQGMNERKKEAQKTYWSHLDAVKTEEEIITVTDGAQITIRIYIPKVTRPNVIYSIHGGGFVAGDLNSEDLLNRQLCHEADALIFSVDYRLAPEFPVVKTIFQDAIDGLKWTLAQKSKYGAKEGAGIIVSGTSVGAGMASMLAFRAKELDFPIKGIVLRQAGFIWGKYEDIAKPEWIPRLKSREENRDAPLLNADMMNNILRLAGISYEDAVKGEYFTIFASKEELSRLPPTYLVAAECDVVVDEVLLFADLLKEAGVETKLKVYKGVPHGFHQHHVLKAARDEMVDTTEGVKWLFGFL